MAVVVHKFPFSNELPEEQIITMPVGAVILCAKMKEDGEAAIWALVDENPTAYEGRTFIIVGTGHVIKEREGNVWVKYVDTILDDRNGTYTYVWHVFEVVTHGK